MNRKLIYIILILIILLIGLGLFMYTQDNSSKIVTVNKINFTLPDGYYEGNSTNDYVNITNGEDTIFITYYNDTNITGHIKDYVKNREQNKQHVEVSNFTINNVRIYKSINNHSNTNHYWFTKHKKTYEIYSWNVVNDMDSIVIDLVRFSE